MKIGINPGYATFYAAIEKNEVLYTTRCDAQYGTPVTYVDAYSIETGQNLWSNYPDVSCLPFDLTYNPYDDRIYGLFYNKSNTNSLMLATIEYSSNGETLTPIKELEGNWVAIAAAPDGQLYAISSDVEKVSMTEVIVHSSSLHKVDRLTGETTLIGETGQKPLLIGSATIDKRSGRMFWTVGPDAESSYLCEVDLQTGVATKIMDFADNRQITGLYVPAPVAEDNAPAEVTQAIAMFDKGSHSGTIRFKAPTTLYDGTAASGELTYTVITNGVTVASGKTAYGVTTTAPVEVPERGLYTFIINVANENGTSPKVNLERFIGFGTPSAPANVNATLDNGVTTITWDAVTGSTDGGYIDTDAIRYTVTRMPDGLVIAENIPATSTTCASEASQEITAYTFKVTADNHGIKSESGESNKIISGTVSLPWCETFESAQSLEPFTIIDANNDGKTWSFYSDHVRASYGKSDMNDWLISPALPLKSGKAYRITFKARSYNSSYPEKLEAKWGDAPAASAMTNTLVETTVLPTQYQELGGYIFPETDGNYFLGIHGVSDADMYYLEVDDITVADGISTSAPSQPTDLTAVADTRNGYKATITLKAPSTSMTGTGITSIDKIELRRGDILIHTFNAPAPGSQQSFEDTADAPGDYTYSAIAYIGDEAGPAASITTFIGTPLPSAPASINVTESNPGEITITWPAVATSATGETINPDNVKYNIYDLSDYHAKVAENVSGCTYTFRGVEEGTQKFVQYAVAAVTDRGEGAETSGKLLPVGTPYENFNESYAGAKASTIYTTERINYGNWGIQDETDINSQDGDGGYISMVGYFAGYCGSMTTGKISLANLTAPLLRFYSYTPDNDGLDLNTLAVSISADGGEFTEVFRKTVIEIGETQGWHEVRIPLTDFAGKNISVRFFASTYDRPYTSTCIDNISVISLEGVDLEANGIAAPTHVRTGEEFTLSVTVTNNGSADAENTIVEIYADGKLAATKDGLTMAALSKNTVDFPLTMHPLAQDPISYTAIVSHSNDNITDNNSSEALIITPVVSVLPTPSALTAKQSAQAVELTWSAPTFGTPATPVTDDFDSATAWAHNAPGWVFIDRDMQPIVGFGEVEIPGITPGATTASFFTFSATGIFQGNQYLLPHSGDQYLSAFARYDDGTTDDWAISPELSGEAQTISFYARSYHALYPERIEVYYSTGSFDPADFVATDFTVETVPNEWTLYNVNIPSGARYFAIRSCATASFMLMIDDVTYTPASSENLSLTGYNIYRDNVKINEAPITGTSFTDNITDDDIHSWVVTAVYNRGESAGSNAATTETSSIDNACSDQISINARTGMIMVTGAEGLPVSVVTVDGKVIFNSYGDAVTEIEVTSGVYIVRAATTTAKIIVR